MCECALKKLSSKKNKRKRKGLAHAIAQTTNRASTLGETVHVTILEKSTEETALLEQGEINAVVPITSVNTLAVQSNQNAVGQTNTDTNIARDRGRGRGRRSFYSNTGENDSYDMFIALLNLSNFFRPNISTTRVLSIGTKFIPKWKFKNRNNVLKNFIDFIRRMHNKVYFTETKPSIKR